MRKLFIVLSLVFFSLIQGAAMAQTSSSTEFSDNLEQQIDRLSPEQKNVLGQLLETMASEVTSGDAATETNQTPVREQLRQAWATYKEFLWTRVTGLPEAISGAGQTVYKLVAGRDTNGNLLFLGGLALTLLIAWLCEFLVERYVRTSRKAGTHKGAETYAQAETLREQLSILFRALARDLTGQITFAVASLIAIQFLFTNDTDAYLATIFVFFAILVYRFSAAILRFILAPFEPQYRLVTTDDWTAKFIYRHLVGIATFTGFALFFMSAMQRLSVDGNQSLTFFAGIIVYGGIIYTSWRARNGLTNILRGGDDDVTPGLERMASWWPVASIVLIVFEYFAAQIARATGALEISPGAAVIVLAIIVAAPFLDTMMRGLVRHLVPQMEGEGPIAEAAYNATRNSYVRIGRVVLFVFLIIISARLLGISIRSFAESGLGVQVAAKGVGFLMILAVGYLVWEFINLFVNRRLVNDIWEAATGESAEQGEGYGAGKSRMATVLPLLRMTLQIVVITLTALLALAQLGVNITPLLAGAGVLGLAVGFGAQTLVKDVVSGVFFLLDDAFRVGEFIDTGGIQGSVEKISVRSLQLRHPNGPVHIVPYGEIAKLTNHSRDYVIMKLKFTVPFDTDVDRVRKIFKKIGQELLQDEGIGKDFIEPFKSQGVAAVNDVGIVLRGKFMAKPGTQWVIRKQVYARVQKAFEENDIHFARREVHVQMRGKEDEEVDEEEVKALAGAAAADASRPQQ